jgi:hypothetical protein
MNDGFYDVEYLDEQKVVYEDEFIRHISFPQSLDIMVDGRAHRGVIMKPPCDREKYRK